MGAQGLGWRPPPGPASQDEPGCGQQGEPSRPRSLRQAARSFWALVSPSGLWVGSVRPEAPRWGAGVEMIADRVCRPLGLASTPAWPRECWSGSLQLASPRPAWELPGSGGSGRGSLQAHSPRPPFPTLLPPGPGPPPQASDQCLSSPLYYLLCKQHPQFMCGLTPALHRMLGTAPSRICHCSCLQMRNLKPTDTGVLPRGHRAGLGPSPLGSGAGLSLTRISGSDCGQDCVVWH